MMLEYENDPSSNFLDKIRCKSDALIFLLEYTSERYGIIIQVNNEVIEDPISTPYEE
jgi:hypothetical protein